MLDETTLNRVRRLVLNMILYGTFHPMRYADCPHCLGTLKLVAVNVARGRPVHLLKCSGCDRIQTRGGRKQGHSLRTRYANVKPTAEAADLAGSV